MISEIVAMAKAFAGTALEDEEETLLLCLCEEAFIRWGNRLKSGLEPEDCAGAMIPACAWTALSGLLAGLGAGEPVSFRAGDIAVHSGGEAARQVKGRQLQREAEAVMAPYVEDEGFVFRGVRG